MFTTIYCITYDEYDRKAFLFEFQKYGNIIFFCSFYTAGLEVVRFKADAQDLVQLCKTEIV